MIGMILNWINSPLKYCVDTLISKFKNSSCQPPCYPSWPGVEYKPINVVTARYSASIYADFKHLKNDEKIPRRCKNICEDYLQQNKNILLCPCRVWRGVYEHGHLETEPE